MSKDNAQTGIDPWIKDKEKLGPISTFAKGLSRLTEPPFILAILSIIFYIFAYRYYEGFSDRLSMPFKGFELPISFFLSVGYVLVIQFLVLAFLISYLVYVYRISRQSQKKPPFWDLSKRERFKALIIALIAYSIGTALVYLFPNQIDFLIQLVVSRVLEHISAVLPLSALVIIFILFYLIALFIFLINTIERWNKNIFKYLSKLVRSKVANYTWYVLTPIVTLTILLFFLEYPYYLGEEAAKNLVEGSPGSLNITLEPINKNFSMPKAPLTLVLYYRDIYFVVEKVKEPPTHAKLFMLPANQVRNVTIKMR